MTSSRSSLVCPEATPYYHCISRVVRRCFLMGVDKLTGKDFSHRRVWVKEELARLSDIFAITVCGFSLMDNHMHNLLRLEEALCASWSDEEVLRRAKALHPHAYREAEQSGRLEAHAQKYRERLTSLSWFMRELNQSIAKRANKQDKVSGRFWEGRFKSVPLLDEGALLTCMAYIDLNPVHAGLASSLSECSYTSIAQRLSEVGEELAGESCAEVKVRLAPMHGEKRGGDDENYSEYIDPLPFSLVDYVALLHYTGRAWRSDKRGALPDDLSDTLKRVRLDDEQWLDSVRHLPSRYAMLGERRLIDAQAKRRDVRACATAWSKRAYRAA